MHVRIQTLVTVLAFLLSALQALSAQAVEQWGLAEVDLRGPSSGNPYVDVQLRARFTQGDQTVEVPGFWDGGAAYKVRFSPPTTGQWRWETKSNVPELNGKSGTLPVMRPAGGNHGPVEVFDTFYLRYADGSPYHQFGTTCYAWVHQPESMQKQTLQTLAASPFNKIRFCVFPKSYAYNKNEPELFAFQKGADGKFDFVRPDPAFWRHFEQRILDLQELGIQADLILWHPYDRWGFADMSDAEDDRYLRYSIARLSAYRNVWWSLANEYDFMTDRPAGHRGNKQWEDWDRFFEILQKEDPHQRLRGIHNGRNWYDHTKAWVTHASLQTSDMTGGVRFREQYHKPVVYDECRYEGNIPQGWGNLTAQEMVQRFWLGTVSGCYVGHGETYLHPEDILWWSKGGVLHGESPKRIQWLKDLMAEAPPFHELQPLGDDQGRFILASPGAYYLVYCVNARPQTVELAGQRPYKVDTLDPWAMTLTPAGTAKPGEFTVTPHRADTVFRFTPYGANEPLRPEARIQAAPTEGVPPLTVSFQAVTTAARADWDLGDGTKATGREAQHTYAEPGVYTVTLTATDAGGGVAVAQTEIVTEHETAEPLVRAGFASGERPAITLHGTAKRGADGALLLPAVAQPWGWVQAGDKPLEELRGLRSFTISGWVRPASLKIGSGGNRIVFCLNRDGDGIDLVCHADGRLRLAVNQWPDGIRNDSPPGKLMVGKWTFFAVTYDAGRSQDNVNWYFSPPLDAPGTTEVTLDRKTTYNNGPVGADLRGLAIGNFNQTMHSYGLDRQFRGEILGLQIFGSRIGRRGALDPEELATHASGL
jgi:PKD repeat protein